METNKQSTNYSSIAMSALGGVAVGMYGYHIAFAKSNNNEENKYKDLLNELSEKLTIIETNEKSKLLGKIENLKNPQNVERAEHAIQTYSK